MTISGNTRTDQCYTVNVGNSQPLTTITMSKPRMSAASILWQHERNRSFVGYWRGNNWQWRIQGAPWQCNFDVNRVHYVHIDNVHARTRFAQTLDGTLPGQNQWIQHIAGGWSFRVCHELWLHAWLLHLYFRLDLDARIAGISKVQTSLWNGPGFS